MRKSSKFVDSDYRDAFIRYSLSSFSAYSDNIKFICFFTIALSLSIA